jgi:tetratricopeptide (TPR) repeat protein
MQEIHPLILEISRIENGLKMSVFEQGELASTLRHFSQIGVSFAEIKKLCEGAAFLLNNLQKKGEANPGMVKDLQRTGQLLWEHLLTRRAKEALISAKSRDLVLSLDEELIDIPWEMLYDGTDFLCLNFNLGRVVRTGEREASPQYRSLGGTAKMLILADPTSDLKSAYLEGLFIKNQLDSRRKEIAVNFKSTAIDTLYVKKNLSDYDIVHFAGHCEYDNLEPRNSGWVFDDGRFTGQDILAMGETFSLPTLVFSNSCNCANPCTELLEADYQKRSYSLASAFLYSGVRHFIGSIRKIEDPVSLIFAKEFYCHLVAGKSVGECVRLGRQRLIKEYGMGGVHWASYLLYGDPNFVLFRGRVKNAKRKIKFSTLKKPLVYASISLALAVLIAYLCVWLPSKNPSVYFLFLKSKKLYRAGENQEAISACNSILEKEPLFLDAYPLLAETYQRLGDRENALKNYFNYARFAEKRGEARHLAGAYIGIGWTYYLKGDYPKAREFYEKALELSSDHNDRLSEGAALRKLALWHMDKEEYGRALELLTRSVEINRDKGYLYAHKYNLACDYFDLGLLFTDKEDFRTAMDFYQKSLRLFEGLRLKHETADCYFNMGELQQMEKRYSAALEFYSKGLKVDEALGNAANLTGDYDMLGELYMEMGDKKQAEEYFNRAIAAASRIDAEPELAAASFHLGVLYKGMGRKNKAREALRAAQEIYSKIDTSDYEKVKQELLSLD